VPPAEYEAQYYESTSVSKSQPWIAAVCVPFAVQLPLTLIGNYIPWLPWLFSIVSLLFSSFLGFVFIAKPCRRYALLIGLIYFPAMIAALIYFSILVVGNVFNDHI
jgi:hypothetical protein